MLPMISLRMTTLLLLLLAASSWADSYGAWAAKAAKAERAGDAPAAVQAWSNALHVWKPADGKKARAKAFAARATLREKAGEQEGALADLGEALKLETKDAKLFHRRGRLHLERGDAHKALSDLYKATTLDLELGPAFLDRARAYELQGDEAFAREDYRMACKLGSKEACAKSKKAKPKAPPKAEVAAPAAEPESPEEEPRTVEQAAALEAEAGPAAPAPAAPKPAPKKSAKGKEVIRAADTASPACVAAVAACAEAEGGTYAACLIRRPVCQTKNVKGCCPEACVRKFKQAMNEASEAQAFREVLESGRPCGASQSLTEDGN